MYRIYLCFVMFLFDDLFPNGVPSNVSVKPKCCLLPYRNFMPNVLNIKISEVFLYNVFTDTMPIVFI